jgi:lysophospholipase L1-like esterase
MTIRFTKSWNGYYEGQIVSNPAGGNTEAQLIALGYAVSDLDGPDNSFELAKFALDSTGNVTGLVGPGGVTSTLAASTSGVVNLTIFGDSMTANASGSSTIASATRTNNVVTLAITGHVTGDGELGNVYNMLDTSFNANGVVMTKVDANTLTYPSVGPNGSTTNLGATKVMQFQRLNYQNDNAYLFWLQAKSGGAFRLQFNGGRNGQDSADMLARYTSEAVVANANTQMNIIMTGYNDFVSAVPAFTADQVYANVVAMVKQTPGKIVVVVSAPPLSSSNVAVTTAMKKEVMRYNRMIKAFCNSTVNVRYADAFKYTVNPTSTVADPIAGMLGADNIHYTPKGQERVAQAIWDVVQYDVPRPTRLICSALDTITNDASSKNIFGTMTFTTSGGALAGSPIATGTVCAGLAVTNTSSGAGASACSMVARADGIGNDLTIAFSPAVVGDTCTVSTTGYLTAGVVVGERVQLVCEVSLTGMAASATNSFLRSIEIYNQFNGSASSGWTAKPQGTSAATYPNSDMTLTIVSPEFTVPIGTTGVGLQMVFTSAVATGSLTIKVGRPSFDRLS